MNTFLFPRSELDKLTQEAVTMKQKILEELKMFVNGNIDISIYPVQHVVGYSLAGDLLVNGKIAKSYEPLDLLFLDLNELMLKMLLKHRRD